MIRTPTTEKDTDTMKTLQGKVTISYHWKRDDGKAIKPAHVEALHETALDRAKDQLAEGYREGELSDMIRMTDADGPDGIEYGGWWISQTETN